MLALEFCWYMSIYREIIWMTVVFGSGDWCSKWAFHSPWCSITCRLCGWHHGSAPRIDVGPTGGRRAEPLTLEELTGWVLAYFFMKVIIQRSSKIHRVWIPNASLTLRSKTVPYMTWQVARPPLQCARLCESLGFMIESLAAADPREGFDPS